MRQRLSVFRLSILALVPLALAIGCGGSRDGGGEDSAAALPGESSGASAVGAIQPCKLLTAGQVATVLPDHDGGMVARAGGSLIEGVDSYQCSYTNANTDLLTVVLTVAVDDERFDEIKPSGFIFTEDQKIDIGERGWLHGEDDHWKVTVVKGRTLIDITLMAEGAGAKTEALLALARAVVAQVD